MAALPTTLPAYYTIALWQSRCCSRRHLRHQMLQPFLPAQWLHEVQGLLEVMSRVRCAFSSVPCHVSGQGSRYATPQSRHRRRHRAPREGTGLLRHPLGSAALTGWHVLRLRHIPMHLSWTQSHGSVTFVRSCGSRRPVPPRMQRGDTGRARVHEHEHTKAHEHVQGPDKERGMRQ